MAGESGQVAEVRQQEGDRVILSLPMVGFPSGFKLNPGERVVIVQDEKGPAVRPLVRAMTTDTVPGEGGALEAGGQNLSVQPSTIREEASLEGGQSGPYDVFVIDHGSAKGAEQVVAIRPARQSE